MTAHYLYDPDFCNVASGWEKGVVEKNVQDSRLRIWIDAKEQRFRSFDELNIWLDTRCRALWSEVPSGSRPLLPVASRCIDGRYGTVTGHTCGNHLEQLLSHNVTFVLPTH